MFNKCCIYILLFALICFAEKDIEENNQEVNKEVKEDFFNFKKFFALPVFAYNEEAGAIFGAGVLFFIDPPAKDGTRAGINNSSMFMITLKKQLEFINKHVYEPVGKNWNLIYHLYISDWPSQFLGTGNDWDEDIYDVFTTKSIHLPVSIGTDLFLPKSWKGKFNYGIELDAEYAAFDYENTRNTDLYTYKNIENSMRFGMGYNLTYNSSERNDWPRKGSFMQIRHIFFSAKDNDFSKSRSFNWKNLDVKTYIPLPFLPEGVLALSSYLEDFDGAVPFDRLAKPDGVGQLRGLQEGYLADKTSWVLQSELRTHLFWRCKGTLFYEAAKVGSSFAELNRNKWHESIGIGGRFMVNEESKTHIRGDLGLIDRKYLGMAIKINEAF